MDICITGMGVVSPIGTGIQHFFEGLSSGENGIRRLKLDQVENLPVRFGGQVPNYQIPEKWMDTKKRRQTPRYLQMGLDAAMQAIEMAGLQAIDPSRIGIVAGSGMGGIEVFEDNVLRFARGGARRVNPFFIPMSISNMLAGWIAIETGFQGANFSISTACATSNHCFLQAASLIRSGQCDVVIAGGSEAAINNPGISGFNAMKALTRNEDSFLTASRPFDQQRDGFVIGEGAGMLVLESSKHAQKRNAPVQAILAGGGMNCDAHHITAPRPDGTGAMQAMQLSLKDSQTAVEDIGWINAHGTSTPQGDLAESRAIENTFGTLASQIPVSSTKSMTGHCLGAAGGIEAITAIHALQTGWAHANLNFRQPDPQIPLNIAQSPVRLQKPAVLSNSFGFGGHNCCIILKLPSASS